MTSLIFFSFILLLGVITSYEDIREGKIRNKYVLSAFIFAFLLNSLMFLGFTGDTGIYEGYYLALILNVVIALLVGFALWMFDMWTPGDAKLFSAYAALMPLTTYQLGYVNYFPSFTLLGNTFIPLFFLILLTIPFSIKNLDRKSAGKLFNPRILLERIMFLFGFLWFFDVLSSSMGMQLTFLMYLLLFMAIPPVIKRIGFISLIHVSIALSIMRIIVDYNTVFTLDFLGFFISLVFIFIIITSVIGLSSFIATTAAVNIKNLRPGMIIAGRIDVGGRETSLRPDRGITAEGIKQLNKFYEEGILRSDFMQIQKTLPFAPFLFSGVLLTYLCQGDLIVFLETLR